MDSRTVEFYRWLYYEEPEVDVARLRALFQELSIHLDERAVDMLARRHALGYEYETLKMIGERHGVSQSRVNEIVYGARRKLLLPAVKARMQALYSSSQEMRWDLSDNAHISNLITVLSERTYRVLLRAGIQTIGELRGYTEEQLLLVRNCGKGSRKEIATALEAIDEKK